MDAFEQVVAAVLWSEGYWVRTNVKVALSDEDRATIGKGINRSWEIDVVAYKAATGELLAVECKSFFDSSGVTARELDPVIPIRKNRYKLFRSSDLRRLVLNRLGQQFAAHGLCPPYTNVVLAMAIGKIRKGDGPAIEQRFASEGWRLFTPEWISARIRLLKDNSYSNDVASIVTKLLLRPII